MVERIREATADGSLAPDVVKRIDAYVATSRDKLLDERKDLPTQIASLSAEAKKLLRAMSGVNEAARRLIEERMEQVGSPSPWLRPRSSARSAVWMTCRPKRDGSARRSATSTRSGMQ